MHRATLRAITAINVGVFCVMLTAAFPLPIPGLQGAPLVGRALPERDSHTLPGEGLGQRLRSADPAVREAAAREAGAAVVRDVVPELRVMVRDDAPGCARAAARALVDLGESLGPLLDCAVRNRDPAAVFALGAIDDPVARRALELFADSTDPRMRAAALRGMSARPSTGLEARIHAALLHPDEVLRSHALEAALDAGLSLPGMTLSGSSSGGGPGAAFVARSPAADEIVLAIAARSGDPASERALSERASCGGSAGLRAARLLARARVRDAGARLDAALDAALPADQVACLDALRGALPQAVIPAVRHRLRHPDGAVRLHAALALGEAGETCAVTVLERDGMTSSDPVVRADVRAVLAGLLR